MCDAQRLPLFRLNVFHADARCDDDSLGVGSRVEIVHRLGLARETRIARITTLQPFEIAWSELKSEGDDWFPHSQRFILRPDAAGGCEVVNTLRGKFHVAGARWWLLPPYRLLAPSILDAENRGIARAVG